MMMVNHKDGKAVRKMTGRSSLLVVLLAAVVLSGCRSMRDKDTELAYRQKGISAMAVGRYEEAVTYFQKALDQSFGGVHELEMDICLYKAEALYLLGRVDEAEELYTALIDFDEIPEAYYLRGNIRFSAGDREAGSEDFAEAIRKDKDNYALYIGIYETMSKYGMGEEAQEYLQRALEIKGNDVENLAERGRIYYLLGDYQTAMEELNAAVDKGSKEADFYLMQVYTAVGDFTEADNHFAAYLSSGIANAHNLMIAGENNLNAGNYEIALKYLKGALELDTIGEADKQQLLRDTIVAYEFSRDFAHAYEMLQSYVKEYPSDFEADRELTFLKTRCEAELYEPESTESEGGQ